MELSASSADGFAVSFTDPNPASFTLSAAPNIITIGAHANQDVPVYVTVDANTLPGVYTVILNARNIENNAETSVLGSFTVNEQETPIDPTNLMVETDANMVKAGDYFRANAYFKEAVASNAATLDFIYDTSKFDYRGFTPADGVTVLTNEATATGRKITVMVDGYNTKFYGEALFSAKEDIELENELNELKLAVNYVVKDTETGEKIVKSEIASTIFTTTSGGPIEGGEYTLITLSNIIDAFGISSTHPDWNTKYVFLDFNNNKVIDIYDVSHVASLIK